MPIFNLVVKVFPNTFGSLPIAYPSAKFINDQISFLITKFNRLTLTSTIYSFLFSYKAFINSNKGLLCKSNIYFDMSKSFGRGR